MERLQAIDRVHGLLMRVMTNWGLLADNIDTPMVGVMRGGWIDGVRATDGIWATDAGMKAELLHVEADKYDCKVTLEDGTVVESGPGADYETVVCWALWKTLVCLSNREHLKQQPGGTREDGQ